MSLKIIFLSPPNSIIKNDSEMLSAMWKYQSYVNYVSNDTTTGPMIKIIQPVILDTVILLILLFFNINLKKPIANMKRIIITA